MLEQHLEAHHGVSGPGRIAGDNDVSRWGNRCLKAGPGVVGKSFLHEVGMPGNNPENLALVTQQVADRQTGPGQERGGCANRDPHRVCCDIAAEQSARVPSQALAVQRHQGRAMAAAWENQLVAPPESSLKVRQDRADENAKIRGRNRSEDLHRHALGSIAEMYIMCRVVERRTVAGISIGDFVAEVGVHRGWVDGAMAANAHADRDIFSSYTGVVETLKYNRQGGANRSPSRRIIDNNGDLSPSPRELIQRLEAFESLQGGTQSIRVMIDYPI